MKKAFLTKCYAYTILGVVFSFSFATPAFAGISEVDDVLENITVTSALLPSMLSGVCYLLGLLIGVTSILKLKEHVEAPTQTPLRTPLIRAIIGGALFSLPIITRVVYNAYNGGTATAFQPTDVLGGAAAGVLGVNVFMQDLNTILDSIKDSLEGAPGMISAVTYLLGLLLTVSGLLKIKEHVERPEQTELREGVIRLLTAGALFAIPTIYEALYQAFGGGPGFAAGFFSGLTFMFSGYGMSLCAPNPGAATLGQNICNITMLHAGVIPAFLAATGYMIGLVLAVWGVLKIKAHVLNPQQVGIQEGIMRLLAAGAFFALPAMVQVIKATMTSGALDVMAFAPRTGFSGTPMPCTGLDGIVYCMMNDVFSPIHIVLNFFAFCAGTILIMIGISRLIKSAQDGARGPAGLGTFMTFIAGGALISYNELVRAASATFFTMPVTFTNGVLEYTTGMTAAEVNHAHTVISAIIKFMIVVGLISFVRGIFIVREVAEGNQQASMMAGVTHMVGGALAVNLGPLINAVENTLGIVGFGINFT